VAGRKAPVAGKEGTILGNAGCGDSPRFLGSLRSTPDAAMDGKSLYPASRRSPDRPTAQNQGCPDLAGRGVGLSQHWRGTVHRNVPDRVGHVGGHLTDEGLRCRPVRHPGQRCGLAAHGERLLTLCGTAVSAVKTRARRPCHTLRHRLRDRYWQLEHRPGTTRRRSRPRVRVAKLRNVEAGGVERRCGQR
jgi:hypothetical protein